VAGALELDGQERVAELRVVAVRVVSALVK